MRDSKATSTSVALMFLLVTGVQAQIITPSKEHITKELNNVNNFSSIRVLGSPDIEYRQSNGSKMTVSIYDSDNLVDLLEASTIDGVLQVNTRKDVKILSRECRLKVIASSPSSNQVDIKGSADVCLKGTIKGDNLNLNIADPGDIEAENLRYANIFALVKRGRDIDLRNVKAITVMSEVSGSNDISMRDSAQKATLMVNGSGGISAEKLATTNVVATVAGPGDIVCYASRRLNARVSDSSGIEYRRNPLVVNKQGKKNSTAGK